MYSCPSYGYKKKRMARYDFVEVLVQYEDEIESFEHAQILCLLAISYQGNDRCYDVLEFLKLKEDIAPFPVYIWEHQYNGRSNTKMFLHPQLISSEAFAKPSCIIPCKFESVSNQIWYQNMQISLGLFLGFLVISLDGRI